ncbi:MAG: sensor histidine kinase [Bacteroidia bacterium]
MNVSQNEIAGVISLWVAGTAFAILMSAFLIYFVMQYRRRQLLHEKQQQEQKLLFQQELMEIQAEIKNESLNYIGRELHDNIGQMASFLKMQVELLLRKSDTHNNELLSELRDHSQSLIDQIRLLSRGLNSQNLERFGLIDMMRFEVDRSNRLGLARIRFEAPEEMPVLSSQAAIFLYRVFQELLNNSLKHSGAGEIFIQLEHENPGIRLHCQDSGKGFDPQSLHQGSGILNLFERCKQIGAELTIASKVEGGASFLINLPAETYKTA